MVHAKSSKAFNSNPWIFQGLIWENPIIWNETLAPISHPVLCLASGHPERSLPGSTVPVAQKPSATDSGGPPTSEVLWTLWGSWVTNTVSCSITLWAPA